VSGRIVDLADMHLGGRRLVAETDARVLGRDIDHVEGIAVAGYIW
jgi:hypothetical protein